VEKRRQKIEAYKGRYLLLSDLSLYLTTTANHVCVSVFRFRHVSPILIQASVAETTEVIYKPIASVEQSDLEILIPADNDTYVDLNIKP